jgi:hypothetical protein
MFPLNRGPHTAEELSLVEEEPQRSTSLSRSDQIALIVVAIGILIVTGLLVALLF